MAEPLVTPARCLLCHRAGDSGYLCVGCTKDTVVRLEALPVLYEGLALFLAPAVTGGPGRGAAPVCAPLPVVLDILDLRGPGGIVGVVESWLGIIRQARRHSPPSRSPLAIEARVTSGVAALIGHMPWVSVSWPDAGAFAADIRELTRSLSSIIRPGEPADRGTTLGPCPADVGDGALCGAVLRLYEGAKVVTCAWCSSTYPPATWAGLKVLMDADEKAAAGAARGWTITAPQ
ncbi:hypothetical protein [Streptomyces sp. NBC_01506]|uniref:hypothetical protein n=1 Tax=Streptomyces sp. NBC_01506 TaxID=2903887 RepID=UPI003870BA0F